MGVLRPGLDEGCPDLARRMNMNLIALLEKKRLNWNLGSRPQRQTTSLVSIDTKEKVIMTRKHGAALTVPCFFSAPNSHSLLRNKSMA